LEHVNQLNKLIKPHLLRREKDDVENSIPGMKETLLYVEITNLQKMCYRAVLERNRELLLRGAGSGAGGVASTFNNISMMLRHCCNHPWLIQEVEDRLGALALALTLTLTLTLTPILNPSLTLAPTPTQTLTLTLALPLTLTRSRTARSTTSTTPTARSGLGLEG